MDPVLYAECDKKEMSKRSSILCKSKRKNTIASTKRESTKRKMRNKTKLNTPKVTYIFISRPFKWQPRLYFDASR